MLKGSEKVLTQKILDAICKDEESKEMVRQHWEKIVKALLDHIINNAQISGSTVTQNGPQSLLNGKIV